VSRPKKIIVSRWAQVMGPVERFDCGDVVIARRRISYTARGTGKSLDSSIVEVCAFRDGKVAHIDVYVKDSAALLVS
jgi:ketosteroid isomerase-like protein